MMQQIFSISCSLQFITRSRLITNKFLLPTMETQILFQLILLCLVVFAQGQESNAIGKEEGNIWDALIAADSENESITFERAPASVYSGPAVAYGVPVVPGPVYRPYPVASASNIGFSAGGTFNPGALLGPKAELLELLTTFIKLKGEVGSKLYAVVVDNWDLIRSVFRTLINSAGTLQSFTLNGVIILRKILEFAARLFGSWEVTVPNVNIDFGTLLKEL